MKADYQLNSFHIVEKFNNNNLITWSYPSVTPQVKEVLLGKILERDQPQHYSYHRTSNNEWVYVWEQYTEQKTYALALVTKTFNAYKYKQFGQSLCRKYEKTYNPVHLVKLYLSAFATGSFTTQENGSNVKVDFDSCNANPQIGELIRTFGLEVILIYNALLLKRRALVYHHDLFSLQQSLISITHLIPTKYRDVSEYLFPLVKNVNTDLKGKNFFIAGIRDKSVKSDHYDIFVNLQKGIVTISPQSKEIFGMTKVHKEIATLMVQHAKSDECDDFRLIETINKRTEEILVKLKALAVAKTEDNRPMITLEELRSKKLTTAMENFLFNLAVAENMMML